MAKQLLYSDQARAKLKAGVDKLADAVATTLGPKGRNVALDKKWGAPNVIHDGVTVAKEIELEDPFENMGAQMVKEAASKTNDVAGDGTTTATILAQAIVDEGMKNIAAGANPMIIRTGIEKASSAVSEQLSKLAKKVKGKDEIAQVAIVSAGNQEIGQMIAAALDKVGPDGVITVEEGRGLNLELDFKEGMEFDRGYVSAYFITNPDKMEASVEDPYILITDKKISSLGEMLPMLENLVKVSKNLVIIADEVDGEALATLVVNKIRGTFNVLAVKAPGFGDRRKEMLSDIATLTGGSLISEDTGRKLDSVSVEDLGRADRVTSDKDTTIVVGGKGSKALIQARIKQLRAQIAKTKSDFDREKLEERLAKLSGGVAVINVGAATEVEMKDRKERVNDAVAATKAAVEEGIVPGGEVAIIKAARIALDPMKLDNTEEQVGVEIIKKAVEVPLRRLAANSGVDEGWVVRKITDQFESSVRKDFNYGYNVLLDEFGDMVKWGILDPVKVTRTALQNASSVAAMILTTEALVTDLPEKNPPAQPGGGMPGGMDY